MGLCRPCPPRLHKGKNVTIHRDMSHDVVKSDTHGLMDRFPKFTGLDEKVMVAFRKAICRGSQVVLRKASVV